MSYADFLLFGGRGTFLLISILLIQLTLAILLTVLRKFGPANLRFQMLAAAVCLFCIFSPLQIDNFIWGFQAEFLLVDSATPGTGRFCWELSAQPRLAFISSTIEHPFITPIRSSPCSSVPQRGGRTRLV
jgi:hypothetical protein